MEFDLNISKWPEGCYKMFIKGVDRHGQNGIGKSAAIYQCIDKTKPVLNSFEVNPPENEDVIKDKAVFTWSGSDKHAVNVYYYVNGKSDELHKISTLENGSEVIDTSYFEPYTNDITLRIVDIAGNYAEKTISCETNKTLPVIKEKNGLISNIKDNPWINDNKKDLYVSWDVEYKDEIGEVNLGKITACVLNEDNSTVDGYEEKEMTFTDEQNPPKEYNRYKINDLFEGFNSLNDGKYKIRMRFYAKDNIGYDEGILLYNKDNIPPTLEILTPEENDEVRGVVAVSYEVNDNGGNIGKKKVSITDTKGREKILTTSLDIYNLNTTEYDPGEYTLKYFVSDMAGNETVKTRKIIIENPPPTPIISLEKSYGKTSDDISLNYNWVKGDEGIKRVDHIEYALNSKEDASF